MTTHAKSDDAKPVVKSITSFEIKDADKGEVRAVIATLGVVDRDGDIIRKGAIPDGSKVAVSAYGHDAVWGNRPVGKGTLSTEGNKVLFDGRLFLNTTDGRDTFEVWIGVNGDAHPGEDITFTYNTLQGNGDGGFLTVGAENLFGNRGQNRYVDGVGTLPVSGTELRVNGTPGAPGETHTITFQVRGVKAGTWTNYAFMTSNLFQGTAAAFFGGQVTQ